MTAGADPEEPPQPEEASDRHDAGARYDRFVSANLKRNYLAHFSDGMLSFTGFRLIATPTFTPAYLFALTGSEALVGVGSSLLQLGIMISPLLVAAALEHRTRILPAALRIGWFMRSMILALALVGWFGTGDGAIAATFAVLFLLGLGTGAQRVSFQLLLSKVIPLALRGRLQGLRNFCGGLIAAALSYLAGAWLLAHDVLGNGYATIFLLAFVLSSLGLTAIALLMREPDAPAVRPRLRLGVRLAAFPQQLRDRDFRRFVGAIATCTLARSASPFYILFAGRTMGLDGATVGALALCFMAADTAANLVWGSIGDRHGYRLTFLASVTLWIGSTVLLLAAANELGLYCAFVGLGASLSGFLMSQQTMVLEFGAREDVAMRLGLSSTVDGVMSAAGPALGGLIALRYGYSPLFVCSIALLCVTLWLVAGLRDPRRPAPG